MSASNDVFISYRRDRGFAWAKLVWDDLRDHGIDAFLDLENVRDAGSFDTKILRQIEGRPYFVIVLTHGSLERCCEEGDWLREELEHAVASDRVLVPLVISPFDFAEADTLGGELAHAIRSANGVTLVPDYFDAAMQRLRDDRLVPIELEVRSFDPSDEAFAAEARARANLLPPPTPPTGRPIVPPPPDAGATIAAGASAVTEPTTPTDTPTTTPTDTPTDTPTEAPTVSEPAAPAEGPAVREPTTPTEEPTVSEPAAPAEEPSVAEPARAAGEPTVREPATPADRSTRPAHTETAERVAPPDTPAEMAPTRSAPAAEPPGRGRTGGGRRSRRWLAVLAVAVLAAAAAAIALVVLSGGDDGPTDRMDVEDMLGPGDRLETEDGNTVLEMGTDGILRGVTGGSLWFSEPSASSAVPGSVARMQEDGNFVIYESEDSREPVDATYATGTFGNEGATLVLLDGGFEIRSASGARLFPRSSQSNDSPAPTTTTEPTTSNSVATQSDSTTP